MLLACPDLTTRPREKGSMRIPKEAVKMPKCPKCQQPSAQPIECETCNRAVGRTQRRSDGPRRDQPSGLVAPRARSIRS